MTIPAQDWRHTQGFEAPQREPWSALGPEFAALWGNSDPKDPQPEHMEIIGQNGSGKTHLLGKIFQERAYVRPHRAHVLIATKPADGTLLKFGWPVVTTWKEVTENRCCIFWPRTELLGQGRRDYHERRISDLLERLYVPDSNTSVAVDDFGYTDSLPRVKMLLADYLREGRSSGLDLTLMKQRPQGSTRLISSETQWTVGFKPKARMDLEYWAELFGSKRDWMPVFDLMDSMRREFVIRHNLTTRSAISWVDEPLAPVEPPGKRRPVRELLGFKPRDTPAKGAK